jgi:hypothetical protein
MERMAPLVGELMVEAVKDMFKHLTINVDISLSTQLFAELQMDPQLKGRIESATDRTSPESMAKELKLKGSARVFLSETQKFSKLLAKEKFAPPVLEKIYVEYQYTGDRPFREGLGPDGQFSSRTITPSGFFSTASGSANEPSARRAITLYESNKRKDPNDPIPLTVHCALVFSTQREGKEVEKILWLDLYLEELKENPLRRAFPWKVTNVQHN